MKLDTRTYIFQFAAAVRVPENIEVCHTSYNLRFKRFKKNNRELVMYLRLARMEVSCKSPGSNSWEPFKPNSSQPRRKTDRLSQREQQGTRGSQHQSGGCCTGLNITLRRCPLTSPAMGVGSLLIFFTSPGLIALSSLWRRGRSRDLLSLSPWELLLRQASENRE